ncbi:glycoside hydrolase family 16 protein [Aquirufa aurantiipilula]|uniref:glycoside hydrolase family 16 protein n=1 Tax=Aquirufa aurantiipilula TaxID=2696561 RepID=UPI001CAA5A2A|nr:glycoside hydrolase family 16 protein [Aquirufa aurantiipilula]MBZ1327288.1 glycoside hydrolase family 16 protein [Aquirufa aurantiipilula]
MKKRISIILGLVLVIFLACKQATVAPEPLNIQNIAPVPSKEYSFTENPVWADEFNQAGLPDDKIWSYDVGGSGWGNNELQYYTKADLDNAHVENGILTIEAKKESFEGKSYTSARLVTKGKKDFLFGRIEVRAKLPAGRGNWPAIWTLASQSEYGQAYWPDNGEIDIMEHVGYDPGVVHSTVHTKSFNHVINTQKAGITQVPDFDQVFHVYRIDWTPEYIKALIDGKEYFTFQNTRVGWEDWPFDKKQHLLLNIAVGGNWGGQKGVDDSIFPSKMLIDYVRVYGLK